MPLKPKKPCAHPGCRSLIETGTHCADHKKHTAAQQYEQRRKDDELVRIRRGSNWRAISLLVRRQQPLCVDPLGLHSGWPAPAQEVHHVLGIEERPDLFFTLSNLASVCRRCHGEIETLHRAGKPTAHLFAGKTAEDVVPAVC